MVESMMSCFRGLTSMFQWFGMLHMPIFGIFRLIKVFNYTIIIIPPPL